MERGVERQMEEKVRGGRRHRRSRRQKYNHTETEKEETIETKEEEKGELYRAVSFEKK